MHHRIQTKVGPDRIIVLDNLPFREGDIVEIVVIPHHSVEQGKRGYLLRGRPVFYENPLSAVADDDWDALP